MMMSPFARQSGLGVVAALEPRSQRPRTSPAALVPEVVDLVVRLRKELTAACLDAGRDHRLAPRASPPTPDLEIDHWRTQRPHPQTPK